MGDLLNAYPAMPELGIEVVDDDVVVRHAEDGAGEAELCHLGAELVYEKRGLGYGCGHGLLLSCLTLRPMLPAILLPLRHAIGALGPVAAPSLASWTRHLGHLLPCTQQERAWI